MKLLRKKDGSIEARFTTTDWECFLAILSLFPCVPPAHHTLSRSGRNDPKLKAGQELLDEAIAEQRAEQKKALQQLLHEPGRVTVTERGFSLLLKPTDLMCLLQVLNDVRVGCWVALGSPERIRTPSSEEKRRDYYSMELAGHYEACFLAVMESSA